MKYIFLITTTIIFIMATVIFLGCVSNEGVKESYPETPLKTLDSVSVPKEYSWVNSLVPDCRNPMTVKTIANFANDKKNQGVNQYHLIGQINSAINFSKNFNVNQKETLSSLVKTIVPMTYENRILSQINESAESACSKYQKMGKESHSSKTKNSDVDTSQRKYVLVSPEAFKPSYAQAKAQCDYEVEAVVPTYSLHRKYESNWSMFADGLIKELNRNSRKRELHELCMKAKGF